MNPERKQPYFGSFLYTLLAESAGIPLRELFTSAESVVQAYRLAHGDLFSPALRDALWEQLQHPGAAPLGYGHVAALGAQIRIPLHGEPSPQPILRGPEEVAGLKEPHDMLATPFVRERVAMAEEIERLWGGGIQVGLNAGAQGPVTTAVLLAGMDFLAWPYEAPEAAHRLLDFCARSAPRFLYEMNRHCNGSWPPVRWGLNDDFAGMFPPPLFDEYVVPSWDRYFREIGCQERFVHSELLRPAHLKRLADLHIAEYDPGTDPYLAPEDLRIHCPVPFQLCINPWQMRDMDAVTLRSLYRHYASFEPTCIQFDIEHPYDEANYLSVLTLAKEMAGE